MVIVYQVRPEHLVCFEADAQSLVSTLVTGGEVDLEALTKSLGATLEFMLCDLFQQQESTSRTWCDGVDLRRVDLPSGSSARVAGLAWCDDGDQWQVPVEILFGFAEVPRFAVASLIIRIGDAAYPTLGAHRGQRPRATAEQQGWLHELVVRCPAARSPLDASALEARLLQWMEANPSRPIVGPDWQPLDREQAMHYIRARCADDRPVMLEETWLDHGPALVIE